jgi:RNA ligase
MKHYSFPKIRQYYQVIRDLKMSYSYVGRDENDEPIYKEPDVWPVIKFKGNTKLHGSFGAIVFSPNGEFYCQSKERIVDEISDNAGFAHWVNKEGFKIWDNLKHIMVSSHSDVIHMILTGEWCGGNVHKGVALNQLSKRFVVFGLKVVYEDETHEWLDSSKILNEDINVFNISRCDSYEINVDLNRPDKAITQMNAWVDEIDKECPWCKTFGISDTGEGIVFSRFGDYGFSNSYKVKGENHSKSKIRKLPTVDVQKMDNLQQAVDIHCHEDRMEQIYEFVVLTEADKTPTNIKNFVCKLIDDCWTEEGDSIRASDITRKEFGAAVSKKGAKWFQNKLQQF